MAFPEMTAPGCAEDFSSRVACIVTRQKDEQLGQFNRLCGPLENGVFAKFRNFFERHCSGSFAISALKLQRCRQRSTGQRSRGR
jgi:hypothetical protein